MQVSFLQLYWKKRLWYMYFLMNSARSLRHLFYRIFPGDCCSSTEKYFPNKTIKSPPEKKIETAGKKSNSTRILFQVFFFIYPFWNIKSKILLLLFKNLFIPLFSIHWKHLETGFVYYRNLFLTLGKLLLISVNLFENK